MSGVSAATCTVSHSEALFCPRGKAHRATRAMSGLRKAVALLSDSACLQSGAPARAHRGKYQALSPRETEFLMASFATDHSPPLAQVEALAALAVLTPQRIRKFFDNQRVACVKEAAAQQQPPAPAIVSSSSRARKRKAVAPPSSDDDQLPSFQFRGTPLSFAIAVCAPCTAGEPELLHAPLQVLQGAVAAAAAAASAASAASAAVASAGPDASAALSSTPPVDDIDDMLRACLHDEPPVPLPRLQPCVASDGSDTSSTNSSPTRGPQTLLERFNRWLQERQIDPFSCARRCSDVFQLASLLEFHGRSTGLVSFFFAGACVLRAAFTLSALEPPASLAAWRALLGDPAVTASLSRHSDSLWYHVRRVGARFSESVPAKARDDTLTALAITAAIAPLDSAMRSLVAHTTTLARALDVSDWTHAHAMCCARFSS